MGLPLEDERLVWAVELLGFHSESDGVVQRAGTHVYALRAT